ncbi:uncharacterized protein N7473_002207 [Penicillium subrubescens]|uniref:Uncharacterized protein n=1 Tax=Penicillium subrubescens TaxID=1316194 RepID=A0A1Q5SXJ4_9EURO|nr:uncharacterized protein N7473_002207 [Penicillium subrubescens]KAJ5905291.1 hypothetical protein N7473_002207 [Penicillium subrubescens]OKO92662.1 hypothetical protein PENSUB_12647 [Penicillium subrubescens]
MDSMRSLNTSLPKSTPRPQPSEQLLQSFKAAALSVTNLYKNAVCEQAQARSAGYQEAIEDLLHFLDRENLGLGDGEGWKVRQWATEKCDGTASQTSDEDDRVDSEKLDRSATPTITRKEAPVAEPTSRQQPATPAAVPRPETTIPAPQPQDANVASPTVFTFTAGPTFPQCQELDMDMQSSDNSTSLSQEGAPVNISLMPRTPRQSHRHNHNHNLNHSCPTTRPPPRETPASLGSKRKFNFPDFFDLSNLPNGRDNSFGGGKRGRFT